MQMHNYVAGYIQRAMTDTDLEAPDLNQANGSTEILQTLYRVHQKDGPEAVKAAWEEVLKHAPEKQYLIKSTREILHVDELKHLPPIKWLIPGMLPYPAIVELHGASGSGKSHFMLHIAAQIAQEKAVLYVAAEGVSGYQMRIEAWKEAYGKVIPYLHFDINAVDLLDEQAVTAFIEEIRHLNLSLIVVDTLHRCMVGGDENSAKDIGLVVKACERIKRELGVTIVLVHHTGKTGNGERGSSSLRCACDSMIELVNKDGLIIVESSKLKDGKPFDTLYMELQEFGDSVALVLRDKQTTATKQQKLTKNETKLLEMLNEAIYRTSGAAYARLRDNTGVAGGTLDRALSKLKAKGYITQSKRGEPYTITEDGIQLVDTP